MTTSSDRTRRNGTTLEASPSRRASPAPRCRASSTAPPRSVPTSGATSRRRSSASATSPIRPRAAWSPGAAARSAWSSPNPPAACSSDPFFPRLLRGISAELTARDLQLILLMPELAGRRRAGPVTTCRPATSTAPCSSASTARTPSPRAWPRRGSPSCSSGRPLRRRFGELRRCRQPPGRAERGRAPHRDGPHARSRRSPVPRTWPPASTAWPATGTPSATRSARPTRPSRPPATSRRRAAPRR